MISQAHTIPDEVFFNIYDFMTDKELIQLHLTCQYYFKQLPHHVSNLRLLQDPIERRRNVVRFIEAMKIMSQCDRPFRLVLEIDGFIMKSLEHAESDLEAITKCIDRILNRFLATTRFLHKGEISSHLIFGKGGLYKMEPRFYRTNTNIIEHNYITFMRKMDEYFNKTVKAVNTISTPLQSGSMFRTKMNQQSHSNLFW